MRMLTAVLATAAVLVMSTAAADAKPKMKVLGWTTQAGSNAPQVRNKQTINQCLDLGTGQRTLNVIYAGKKIEKGTKVGIGVWGGPADAGFAEEPTNAAVKANAFRWPVQSFDSYGSAYGYSFGPGPFGPMNIDGVWHAKILIKNKQVATGQVTVACG